MLNEAILHVNATLGSSTTEVLKDISSLKPVSEAVEASLPYLFSSFISNYFSRLLNNHKFRNGCNVVFLLQFTAKKKGIS